MDAVTVEKLRLTRRWGPVLDSVRARPGTRQAAGRMKAVGRAQPVSSIPDAPYDAEEKALQLCTASARASEQVVSGDERRRVGSTGCALREQSLSSLEAEKRETRDSNVVDANRWR